MLHAAADLRFGVAANSSWVQAASAMPREYAMAGPPAPRLTVTRWPSGAELLIVAELRPEQVKVLAPGFARWTGDHLVAPFHPRGIIERTATGAALLINGVLIASGESEADEDEWLHATQCTVGVLTLGLTSGNPHLLAAEFAELLQAGEALLADVPFSDLQPSWSRS
ncbi:MAG TPA: hypothetical protein DGT23_23990 [Micromonosporaceae bacterium]|nr:hypothetical protein [Micromonosporaceae bacterium]